MDKNGTLNLSCHTLARHPTNFFQRERERKEGDIDGDDGLKTRTLFFFPFYPSSCLLVSSHKSSSGDPRRHWPFATPFTTAAGDGREGERDTLCTVCYVLYYSMRCGLCRSLSLSLSLSLFFSVACLGKAIAMGWVGPVMVPFSKRSVPPFVRSVMAWYIVQWVGGWPLDDCIFPPISCFLLLLLSTFAS